ncbi:hypothetical protein GCM10009570_20640 [Dietzia natronolimnaea]
MGRQTQIHSCRSTDDRHPTLVERLDARSDAPGLVPPRHALSSHSSLPTRSPAVPPWSVDVPVTTCTALTSRFDTATIVDGGMLPWGPLLRFRTRNGSSGTGRQELDEEAGADG